MKRLLALLLGLMMVLTFTFLTACGGQDTADSQDSAADTAAEEQASEDQAAEEQGTEEQAADESDGVNGALYGYTGDDPVVAAVYQYVAEEVAQKFDLPDGAVSIPTVQIVETEIDTEDGEAEVKGDFWVDNYVIEGDTLKSISGGNFPGKMELIQVGSGYTVTEMENVSDGEYFDESARDIFEERYDDFIKVNSDHEGREKLRAQTVADYVKANGLAVTKYQDEGWDPVDLPL